MMPKGTEVLLTTLRNTLPEAALLKHYLARPARLR